MSGIVPIDITKALVSGQEWSLTQNLAYSAASLQAGIAVADVELNAPAIAIGDEIELRLRATIGGSVVIVERWYLGGTVTNAKIELGTVGPGWEFTALLNSAASVTLSSSIKPIGSSSDVELADALLDRVATTHLTANTVGALINSTIARLQDLQARIPDALDSGNLKAVVKAMDANVLTASALATDAVTEIAAGVGGSGGGSGPSAATIAAAVWDELISGHLTAGTFGALVNAIAGYLDTEISSIKATVEALPATILGTAIEAGYSVADAEEHRERGCRQEHGQRVPQSERHRGSDHRDR
jgi:hypothetical protein